MGLEILFEMIEAIGYKIENDCICSELSYDPNDCFSSLLDSVQTAVLLEADYAANRRQLAHRLKQRSDSGLRPGFC